MASWKFAAVGNSVNPDAEIETPAAMAISDICVLNTLQDSTARMHRVIPYYLFI